MIVRGRVIDTGGNPVSGAVIDVWQTNEDGFYDVQQKGVQPDWNLRASSRRAMTVSTGFARPSHAITRSPTMGQSGRCWQRLDGIPTVPRTSISL